MIKNSKARHRASGLPSVHKLTKTGRRLRLAFGGLALALTVALSGCGPAGTPIPQEPSGKPVAATAATRVIPPKPLPRKPVVSSCDAVREAFLTGTQPQLLAALKRLKLDRSADGTAREYADYYLTRDAKDKDVREMDRGLIVMSCGV